MREILEHNAAGHSWKMGINEFTDWTEGELESLRGYRRQHVGYNMPSSVMQLGDAGDEEPSNRAKPSGSGGAKPSGGTSAFTESLDWSSQLATSKEIISQGACGSCWAVAAAAAIQLHANKLFPHFKSVLSPENINKCAPNPMECGGQGGCRGSTPGLAFEYLKNEFAAKGSKGGLFPLDDLPYTASTGMTIPEASCSANEPSFLQVNKKGQLKNLRSLTTLPAVTISGYKMIEPNNGAQVMDALVTQGPLAVAVVGSGIQGYDSGVLNKCRSNVVDHAVVMMGFGQDSKSGLKYWNIRNSWGTYWGEDGFFRLQRHYAQGAKGSSEPCGWDNDPAKGIACKNDKGEYPARSWVCGECGIIFDVGYPTGVKVASAPAQ
jgi:cathepsin L